jgi:hypothetical protein
MFSLAESFQRQGLVGLGAISSMMMFSSAEADTETGVTGAGNLAPGPSDSNEGDDNLSQALTELDSCAMVGEEEEDDDDEERYSDEAEVIEDSRICVAQEVDNFEILYEHDKRKTACQQYRNANSFPTDKSGLTDDGIPYEDDKPYDDGREDGKQEILQGEGSRHFLFDIPYEDYNLKGTIQRISDSTLKNVPCEYDTVTTSSGSFTLGGDHIEVDEDGQECKYESAAMPVVEENNVESDDDDDDALRNLLISLATCEEEQVAESDRKIVDREDDVLAEILETLNETEEDTGSEHTDEENNNAISHKAGLHHEAEEWDEVEEIPKKDVHRLPGFTVNVEVRPTPHLGENQYGVFTLQEIPANHAIWEWTRCLNAYHQSELETYIESNFKPDDLEGIQTFLRRGIVLKAPADCYFVSAMTDSIGLMNCSSSPNCRHFRATRDIYEGEELTLDYAFYGNPQWYVDMCHKYGIMTGMEIAERQQKLGENRFLAADFVDEIEAENDEWIVQYVYSLG